MKQKFHRGGYVAGGAFKKNIQAHPGNTGVLSVVEPFLLSNFSGDSKKASFLRCQPCGNGFLQRSS